MRICHITTVHQRYDVRIFNKECKSLVQVFNDMHLIVADGKGDEIKDGIRIYDIGKPSGRIKRILTIKKRIKKIANQITADIYHIHDPELLQTCKFLIKSGAKVFYDSHEDVPRQILNKPYIPIFLRGIVSTMYERYENNVVRKISGIIAATPYIRDRFKKINPNCTDINNYPILDEIIFNENWDNKEKAIGYVGGIFKTRGIFESLECVHGTDIKFYLAGKFAPDSLEKECKSHPGWNNVDFYGFINRIQVNELLERIRLGFVILEATPSYIVSLPVKMFEYMAAGIPIIASDFPLWREIITEANCGVCVDQTNPNDIRDKIKSIIDNIDLLKEFGKNGRKFVEEKCNWEIEKVKLIEFYNKTYNL